MNYPNSCDKQPCGMSGGCDHVNAGPDSHKVCPSCEGTGVERGTDA